RPGACERDPAPCTAFAVQSVDRALRRRAPTPRHRDARRPRARARAARAGEGRLRRVPDPRPPRRAVPAVRNADRPRRFRGAHDLLLPELSDGEPAAQGQAALPTLALTTHCYGGAG